MKIAVSGIQPSGEITLGNYIGSINNIVKMQKEYKLYVFIANLHSITMPFTKINLKNNIKKLVKIYLACGVDPTKTSLFIQSDVLEHTQLAYILICHTTLAELQKMTQFKDKLTKGAKIENGTVTISTGLLTYPGLMAADILLYNPDVVPVGDDQKQHLEITRNIAQRINNKFGNIFTIPVPIINQEGGRIMSLINPLKKMSKSDSNSKSYILLLDDLTLVRKKINGAITDCENKVYYDKINKPGIANLIEIYGALEKITITKAEKKLKGLDYKKFKTIVADVVCKTLKIIQSRYQKLDDNTLDNILINGANEARCIATKTLQKTQNKLGINYVKK